jgi:hypothetical protein
VPQIYWRTTVARQLPEDSSLSAGSYASAAAFSDEFAPALAAAAGLTLAGGFVALALPGRPNRIQTAAVQDLIGATEIP